MVLIIEAERFGESSEHDEVLSSHLNDGGLVVYPTDTLYGLGGKPDIEFVAAKIFELKRRERGKPFPYLVDDVERALSMFEEVTPLMTKLANKFWPGRLTIVSRKRRGLFLCGSETSGTVGVRVPGSVVARKLARLAGGAIIGTSANLSGEEPVFSFEGVKKMFGVEGVILVDGGELPPSRGSTVVEVIGNRVRVLREGDIASHEIEKTVRE